MESTRRSFIGATSSLSAFSLTSIENLYQMRLSDQESIQSLERFVDTNQGDVLEATVRTADGPIAVGTATPRGNIEHHSVTKSGEKGDILLARVNSDDGEISSSVVEVPESIHVTDVVATDDGFVVVGTEGNSIVAYRFRSVTEYAERWRSSTSLRAVQPRAQPVGDRIVLTWDARAPSRADVFVEIRDLNGNRIARKRHDNVRPSSLFVREKTVYLAGYDFGSNSERIWRIDPSTAGMTVETSVRYGHVVPTKDGYLSAQFPGGGLLVQYYDADGTRLGERQTYSVGLGENHRRLSSIVADDERTIVLCTGQKHDRGPMWSWIAAFDRDGLHWKRTFGRPDEHWIGLDLLALDGGYLLAGTRGNGEYNGWLFTSTGSPTESEGLATPTPTTDRSTTNQATPEQTPRTNKSTTSTGSSTADTTETPGFDAVAGTTAAFLAGGKLIYDKFRNDP